MSLEQALHELWRADHRLSSLVAPQHVFTELAAGEQPLPYVALNRVAHAGTSFSSSRRFERIVVAWHVWAATLEAAQQIADAIAGCFDRREFATSVGTVRNMQRGGQRQGLLDPARYGAAGPWRVVADYTVLLETPMPAVHP